MEAQTVDRSQSELNAVSANGPLSPEDLAAYLDGRLNGQELERGESVLAGSPSAREELVDVSRMISTIPEPKPVSRRRWILPSLAAAAAAVVLVTVPSLSRKPVESKVESERRAVPDDDIRLRTLAPSDGATLNENLPMFLWNSLPGATYRLTVTTAEGETVWQTSTGDTAVSLPASTRISRGASYYWSVDALREDGSSATSGVREFKLPAK